MLVYIGRQVVRWQVSITHFSFALHAPVVVHIRWENIREKNLVKGIYIICLIYKLHYSSGQVVEYDGCRWVEPGWSQTCDWQWFIHPILHDVFCSLVSHHDGPSFFHPTDATLSTGPASCTVQNPSSSICLRQCWWCCSHGSPQGTFMPTVTFWNPCDKRHIRCVVSCWCFRASLYTNAQRQRQLGFVLDIRKDWWRLKCKQQTVAVPRPLFHVMFEKGGWFVFSAATQLERFISKQ